MNDGLTLAGLIIMVMSVGSVLALVTYCLYRVLTLPPMEVEEHLKEITDIDTKDTTDAD